MDEAALIAEVHGWLQKALPILNILAGKSASQSTATAPTSSPVSGTLTLGVTTDIGAVANAAAGMFKLADSLVGVVDSPNMIAARQSAAIQAALAKMDDDLAEAQKTNDLTKINSEASG